MLQTTNSSESPQAPLSLLKRLANDADFRARVEADPVSAFAEEGIHLDPSMVPETVTLPKLEAWGGPDDPDSLINPSTDISWRGLL